MKSEYCWNLPYDRFYGFSFRDTIGIYNTPVFITHHTLHKQTHRNISNNVSNQRLFINLVKCYM